MGNSNENTKSYRYSRRRAIGQSLQASILLLLGRGITACRNAATISKASSKVLSDQDDVEYDCLVLGGGLAGMAAANALAFPRSTDSTINGLSRKVLLIEGQGRIGGRLLTIRHPEFGGPIELGAQYIHVDDDDGENGASLSLWQAIHEYQIRITKIFRLRFGVVFSKYFKKMRAHWSTIFEIPAEDLLTFRREIMEFRGPDLDCRTWVEKGPAGPDGKPKGKPFSKKFKPFVDIFLSGPASAPLEKLSLKGFNADRFGDMESGNYEYKLNNGWNDLISLLRFPGGGKTSLPVRTGELPIRYNSCVRKIDYSSRGVRVIVEETNGGRPGAGPLDGMPIRREYRAKTAILTFPIGVLRRATGIDDEPLAQLLEFSPPLPQSKLAAMKAIGSGVAAKMFIAFDERFWDEDTALINRIDGLSSMGRTYFVSNYGDNANNFVLGAYFGGAEAIKIAEWTEERVLTGICYELAEIFPAAAKERPIHDRVKNGRDGRKLVIYKHWAKDPWAFGNDSYLEFGSGSSVVALEDARRILADHRPTPGLFWAGEATVYADGNNEYAPAHAGVTHGAHTSGIRVAKEVATYLDRHG